MRFGKMEIVKAMAKKTGFTKFECGIAYDAMIDVIKEWCVEAEAGDRCNLNGLLGMTMTATKEQENYHCYLTKQTGFLPSRRVVKFKLNPQLTDIYKQEAPFEVSE